MKKGKLKNIMRNKNKNNKISKKYIIEKLNIYINELQKLFTSVQKALVFRTKISGGKNVLNKGQINFYFNIFKIKNYGSKLKIK